MEDFQDENIISCPAWDTQYNCLIYPISPKHRESVAALLPHITHILSDNKKDDLPERYRCTECGDKVHPKRGGKKRWHFAHYPGNSCTAIGTMKIGSESSNHKLAKYVLYDLLRNNRPITLLGAKCITTFCSNRLAGDNIEYEDGDIVKMEYNLTDGGRADVVIINEEGVRYIFEIYNSSKTEHRGGEWWEIDALEILGKDEEIKSGIHLTFQDIKRYRCGACPQITNPDKLIVEDNNCDKEPNVTADKRKCNSTGECLIQLTYGDNGYCTDNDSCCEPVICSGCNKLVPQWLLDCGGGICTMCDMNGRNIITRNSDRNIIDNMISNSAISSNLIHNINTRKKYLPRNVIFDFDIYRAFYIMETISFTKNLIEITASILRNKAPNNLHVKYAWKEWVMDNKPIYTERFPIGKRQGERICDAPDWYIESLSKHQTLGKRGYDSLQGKIDYLSMFNEKNINMIYNENEGKYHLGYLITRYRSYMNDDNAYVIINSPNDYYKD